MAGVGKSIATGRGRAAHADQRTGVQLQGIAQIIQAKAVAELAVEQAHHMAPRRKAARLILGSRDPRNFWQKKRRNIIANLAQDGELGMGWSYFDLVHPCRVAGANKKLQPFLSKPVRWLCLFYSFPFSYHCCCWSILTPMIVQIVSLADYLTTWIPSKVSFSFGGNQ